MRNRIKLFPLNLLLFVTTILYAQSPMAPGFNMLETGKFAEAKIFFEEYLKTDSDNKTAKLCYGRAVGLSGDPQKAKVVFGELLKLEPKNLEFRINAAECLLWNKEFDAALVSYSDLEQSYDPNPIIELGLANTYSNLKKYKKAIHHYKKGVALNPKILGIYIGLAYTYQANNENKYALETIEKALELDPKHKQLSGLKKTITQKYKPQITQKGIITSDSGDNQSLNSKTDINYPLSTKSSIGAYYHFRESSNTVIDINSSRQKTFGVTSSYQITNKINLMANVGYLDIKGDNTYSDFIYKFGSNIKLSHNQDLNIYYQKEYHNFNVQLINSEISQNHLFANYHIITKYDIGLFTQYYYTTQSDDNKRNLLFTSLYYLLKKSTPIKVGLNSVIMSFDKERAEVYFSPEKYLVFETFIDFSFTQPSTKIILDGNAAYGYQIINSENKQQSFRMKLNFGYKFSDNIKLMAYGEYSNQAVGNASGFEFNELGIILKCNF